MFYQSRILSINTGKDGSAMIVVEAEDGADTTTLVRPARVHPDDIGKVWWALCNYDHHSPEPVDEREGRLLDTLVERRVGTNNTKFQPGVRIKTVYSEFPPGEVEEVTEHPEPDEVGYRWIHKVKFDDGETMLMRGDEIKERA
jgi:hypothetical protein